MESEADILISALCDVSGKIFELSADRGLDSTDFIEKYMNSDVCAHFDMPFDHTQWAGEQYVFGAFLDEVSVKKGDSFNCNALFWIGYTYRFWHLLTGESSREIYKQADAGFMFFVYPGYHTLSVEMAIARIKEQVRQRETSGL